LGGREVVFVYGGGGGGVKPFEGSRGVYCRSEAQPWGDARSASWGNRGTPYLNSNHSKTDENVGKRPTRFLTGKFSKTSQKEDRVNLGTRTSKSLRSSLHGQHGGGGGKEQQRVRRVNRVGGRRSEFVVAGFNRLVGHSLGGNMVTNRRRRRRGWFPKQRGLKNSKNHNPPGGRGTSNREGGVKRKKRGRASPKKKRIKKMGGREKR